MIKNFLFVEGGHQRQQGFTPGALLTDAGGQELKDCSGD